MAAVSPQQPLGIGQLVTSTFGLLFRHIGLFLGIALLPSLLQALIQLLAFPSDFGDVNAEIDPGMLATTIFVVVAVSLVISLLTMGAITLAAYDARVGRPIRVGSYVGRTLAAAPAIVVLGLVLYIFMSIGFLLLVIPGLYLMARYWVLSPVILVERSGFRGLSRTAELTAGYRWPILGAAILMFLVLFLISLVLTAVLGVAAAPGPLGAGAFLTPGYAVILLVQALSAAIQIALLSIFTALVYARLREIKEGLGMEDLASVFA
ncbi:hypothetical protein ACW9UR_01955 [Halovulum sp. GXIMD14794]